MINRSTLEIYNYMIEYSAHKTASELPKWRRQVSSEIPALNEAWNNLETILNSATRRERYCLSLSYFGKESARFIRVRSVL